MPGKKFKEKIHERFMLKKREASMSHSPTNVHVPTSRRISADYLREETEIQKILHSQPQEGMEESQTEREIAFFTAAVAADDEDPDYTDIQHQSDGNLTEISERSLPSGSPGPLRDTQESPVHLASSYIQTDDHIPIFERVKIPFSYDRELLTTFQESCRLSRRDADIIDRNVEEEGLYRPSLTMSERKLQWFNQMAEERIENPEESNNYRPFLQLPEIPHPENIPTVFVCLREENLSYTPYMLDHKILSIHLSKIQFGHHHLFSEEHVLAQKVEDLFTVYCGLQKSNPTGKLRQMLITLRKICKELTDKDSKSDDNAIKLARSSEELKDTRAKLHEEEQKIRENIKDLLSEYRKLKSLREKQKFNLTSIKLTIKATEMNKEEDEAAFDRDFNEELEELLEEAFQEYLEEKKKYRELVKSIKEGDTVPDQIERPDVEEIKKNLQEVYAKSRRGIGEPIVQVITSKIEITAPKNAPMEVNRIRKLQNTKFILKLSLNEDVVDVVRDLHIDDRFEIKINTSISVRLIRRLPEKIKLQIFEVQSVIPRLKIASIILPIPADRDIFDHCPIRSFNFSSDRDIPSDVGVGTGKYCRIEGSQDLHIHGKIFLKIGWSHRDAKTDQPSEFRDPQALAKVAARKWRDHLQWDPLDPENDFTSMHDIVDHPIDPRIAEEQIPLTEIQDDEKLAFCPPEVVENNTRLNLLIERARLTAQFKDMKLIPQEEREIHLRKDSRIIDETLGMDPIDLCRHQGKKNLQKLFANVAQVNEIANRENEDSRLLFREDAPSLSTLGHAILAILGSKRPLKPTTRRNHSIKPSFRMDDSQKYTISVNVVRAFGIPSRTDDQLPQSVRRSSNISSAQQSFRTINVRPYVVILFKDKTARTSTAEGSNPTWNEQLQIPINFKLDQLKGSLCIQLFDEFVDDLLEDDRLGMSEIYQRISRKWIGELRIPITSIYTNQRIEGTFELNSPKVLLGYSKSSLNPGTASIFTENLPDTRGPIYLSLFIGLEPNFDQPYFTTKYLDCMESDQIKGTIQIWSMEYSNEFPHRFSDPLVTLTTGKRVTITKLLGALEVPFDVRESSRECLIRRFVSLIPVLQTTDPLGQLNGAWLTNSEILTHMYATPKDLAVLLTCFYMYLDFSVWLVFGEDRVVGPTCYVLIKENGNFYLVDPVSGRKYSSSDTYCPLVKVSLLANQNNVWGNIQSEKRVYLTQFDVKKSVDWRPLFRKNVDIPGDFLQDTTFEYKRTYPVSDLQKVIEMKLMKKISQWRGHRKTIWNRFLRDQLKSVLIELEAATTSELSVEEQIEKINVFLTTFKASGFPLNIPYYSLSHVVERVKSTGMHMNMDNRVEFALAVHIHPYENNVLSVWIFLLSLLPRV